MRDDLPTIAGTGGTPTPPTPPSPPSSPSQPPITPSPPSPLQLDGTLVLPAGTAPVPESLIQPVPGLTPVGPLPSPADDFFGTVAMPSPSPRTGVNTGHYVPQPLGASASAPSVQPASAAQRIGRYTILKSLGEGGFGTVYLAEQHEPVRRKVALKVVKLGMDTAEVILRFEAERQALAMMDHPSVAKVYDAGVTERGQPFFAMEYVEGVPLGDYADGDRLSLQSRIELFILVCQAVQHAHQKGLIHRDLKPGNIMVSTVDGKPMPKVIDFGIAKATGPSLSDTAMQTVSGQLMGTPEYMSPEQTAGSADIDTRTDVYALGVVLYELLTGVLPFDSKELRASGLTSIAHIIKTVEPARPSTRILSARPAPETVSLATLRRTDPRHWQRQIAGDLDWITLKAMEKERDRRYESAAALALDLQRFLASEPVLASPPSTIYRLRKFARRNKVLFAASTAVAIALVFGLTAATAGFVSASRDRDRARVAQSKAELALDGEKKARLAADFAREAAVSERNKAQLELLKSNQLSKFLAKMFASIDPNVAKGRDVLVRSVLDAAAADLEAGALADRPAVEAEVRDLIGNTYAAIGGFKVAESHLRRAMELHTAESGVASPPALKSSEKLGISLLQQSRAEEALPLFVKAIETRRRYYPDDADGLSKVLADQASTLIALNRLDLAEPPLRESLALVERHAGPNSPATGAALSNLGKLLLQQGDEGMAASEPLFRRALAIYLPVYATDDLRIATVQFNLAVACASRGNLAEAHTLLLDALAVRRKVLPADHPEIARAQEVLASLLDRQGEALMGLANVGTKPATRPIPAAPGVSPIMQARQVFEEAARLKSAMNPQHPGLARTLEALGDTCQDLGDLEASEQALKSALDLRRAQQGPADPATIAAMNNLASLYQRREMYSRGLPLAEEAVARARAMKPTPGPQVMALYLAQLGTLQLETGDALRAEATLKECLVLREKFLAPGAWQLHNTRSMLGGTLVFQGRAAEAVPTLAEAAAEMAKDPLCPPARLAKARSRLAEARSAATRPSAPPAK